LRNLGRSPWDSTLSLLRRHECVVETGDLPSSPPRTKTKLCTALCSPARGPDGALRTAVAWARITSSETPGTRQLEVGAAALVDRIEDGLVPGRDRFSAVKLLASDGDEVSVGGKGFAERPAVGSFQARSRRPISSAATPSAPQLMFVSLHFTRSRGLRLLPTAMMHANEAAHLAKSLFTTLRRSHSNYFRTSLSDLRGYSEGLKGIQKRAAAR
jgi:hypothetical protein